MHKHLIRQKIWRYHPNGIVGRREPCQESPSQLADVVVRSVNDPPRHNAPGALGLGEPRMPSQDFPRGELPVVRKNHLHLPDDRTGEPEMGIPNSQSSIGMKREASRVMAL